MDDEKEVIDDERIETINVALRLVVSFDVSGHRPGVGVAINQYIHGRKVTIRSNGGRKRYFYEGLVSKPGVEKLGQSVLLMKEKDAEEFASFLWRLKVPCRQWRVWLRPVDLP